MKTEPDTFSIADLERVKIEPWSGVRSTFARFHMRKMEVGDLALFYHSSVIPPGAVGVAKIVRTKVVDQTQFDPNSQYYDPKATTEKPIWDCVDVEYVATFPHPVTLERMRADPMLADMPVLRIGRLSVQPCAEHEYRRVVELGHTAPPPPAPKAKKSSAPKKKPVAKKPPPKKAKAKAKKR
jgi:predicted RNA-binding protein with PUA-like domain